MIIKSSKYINHYTMASLHINKEYDEALNQLSSRLGISKKEAAEKSILYIYKNKINPENLKEGDPSTELKLLRKDLIGFIKTQEKEKLEPISQKQDYIIDKLNKIGFPSSNTSSPNLTTEQYQNLVASYKKLAENYTNLGDHYNKTNVNISNKLTELTKGVGTLNDTVESKLSKKLL